MPDPKTIVVADIGGTNARFAHLDVQGRPGPATTLATAGYPGPGEALEEYLGSTGRTRPKVFILALAGPVSGDRAALSAHEWRFSIQGLKIKLGLERLEALNDFEATALALPLLQTSDLVALGPELETGPERAALAVLGPGTGLGMAGLLPRENGWKVVSSEGGYTALAPYSDRELAVWQVLRDKHGRVFKELVLSGPGLTGLYRALAQVDGREEEALSPKEIVEAALDRKSGPAWETVEMFCAWLGDAAGDAALMYNALGGVYLAGGIVPRILEIVKESQFRERFEDKAWGSTLVRKIPTRAIIHPAPGLLGCAALARQAG